MTKRRQKPGPKPGTTGAGRTARLHLRVTPAEHAAYTAYASRWGLSVAEWARDVLTAQLPPGEAPTAPSATPTRP